MNDLIIVLCIAGIIINIALIVKFLKLCNNVENINRIIERRTGKPLTALLSDDPKELKESLVEQYVWRVERIVTGDYLKPDKIEMLETLTEHYDKTAHKYGVDVDFKKLSEGLYEKMTAFLNNG